MTNTNALLQMAMGAMGTAIATMNKPHYGDTETALDNACDARDGLVTALQDIVNKHEQEES